MSYLVTGATGGIGQPVVRTLIGRGFRVVAVARSEEKLKHLGDRYPGQVVEVVADLSDQAGIDKVAEAVSQEGDLDGFIKAAGSLVQLEPFLSINPGELLNHFSVHTAAPMALIQALVPKVRIGRILFVDSYAASQPREGWAAYSILKAATQMTARCAQSELGSTLVFRVLPGAVDSPLIALAESSDSPSGDLYRKMRMEGKVADPELIASFMVKLMVDAPDELLGSVDAWDFNNAEHRVHVGKLEEGSE